MTRSSRWLAVGRHRRRRSPRIEIVVGAQATAVSAARRAVKPPPPARPPVPRRRRTGLAQRDGHRRHGALRHRPRAAEDFSVFEDGVKQDVTFFNKTEPADCAGVDARHQRQHGMRSCRPRRRRRSASSQKLRTQDRRRDHRFRQPRHHRRAASRADGTRSGAGDPQDVGRRLDVAATTPSTSRSRISRSWSPRTSRRFGGGRSSCSPDGEDTSSLLPFEEVLDLAKRSETRDLRDRPSRGRMPSTDDARASRRPSSSLRQFAQETGGRAFFPNQVAGSRRASTARSPDELSSQYTVGYTSRNPAPRRRVAAHRRARERSAAHGAHQAGLLRADFALDWAGRQVRAGQAVGDVSSSLPAHQPHLPYLPQRT